MSKYSLKEGGPIFSITPSQVRVHCLLVGAMEIRVSPTSHRHRAIRCRVTAVPNRNRIRYTREVTFGRKCEFCIVDPIGNSTKLEIMLITNAFGRVIPHCHVDIDSFDL